MNLNNQTLTKGVSLVNLVDAVAVTLIKNGPKGWLTDNPKYRFISTKDLSNWTLKDTDNLFNSLVQHEALFDADGRLHYLKDKTETGWITNQGAVVDAKEIASNKFHRPTKVDVARLINRTTNPKQLEWITRNFTQYCKAIMQEGEELGAITPEQNPFFKAYNLAIPKQPQLKLTPQEEQSKWQTLILDPWHPQYHEALEKIKAATELTFDLETFSSTDDKHDGLHPWKAEIRLMQIGVGRTIYIFDWGHKETAQLNLFAIGKRNRDDYSQSYGELVEELRDRLTSPNCKIIGHNIQFDLLQLATKFNITSPTNISDTMLGCKCALGYYGKSDEDHSAPLFKFDLGSCLRRFLHQTIDKSQQKSDWSSPELSTEQMKYAANDIKWTKLLHDILNNINPENPFYYEGWMELWALENNCIPPAITMTLNGIPLDKGQLTHQLSEANHHLQQLQAEWDKLDFSLATTIGNSALKGIKRKKFTAQTTIHPTQKQALKEFMQAKYNIDLDKFDKEALADYTDHPVVALCLKFNALHSYTKDLKAFERAEQNQNDGRIHTIYNTLTGTGRFSSGGKVLKDLPNLHSIGAKTNPYIKAIGLPPIRSCIRPRPGYKLIISDLAAAHARIAADWGKDQNAITTQNDDSIDSHSQIAEYVASALGRSDLDWQMISKLCGKWHYQEGEIPIDKNHPDKAYAKQCREIAKNTFYGWLNGAGARRTKTTIKGQSGLDVSIEACEGAIDGCRNKYPKIEPNRNRFVNDVSRNISPCTTDAGKRHLALVPIDKVGAQIVFEAVESFRNKGKMEAPYTQVLASIWSRTEATVMKRSLIELDNLIKSKSEWSDVKLINYVHDELNVESPEELALEVATAVRDVMAQNMQAVLDQVHHGCAGNPSDLIADSWADK